MLTEVGRGTIQVGGDAALGKGLAEAVGCPVLYAGISQSAADPDGWKRTQLSEEISKLVREAFRRQYPHLDRCKDEKIAEHDWKFPDSALMLPYAYASNKTLSLLR